MWYLVLHGRDLLKWCKRITGLRFCIDGSLSEEQCNSIYTEVCFFFFGFLHFSFDIYFIVTSCVACIISQAVDVFATFPASFDNRLSIMKEIGKLWKRDSAAETLYPLDKPIYQVIFIEV